MKLTKLIAAFALLSLAACEGYKSYLPSRADPVPTNTVLVLGQPVEQSRDSAVLRQLTSQLSEAKIGQAVDLFVDGRVFRGANTGFGAMFADSLLNGGFGEEISAEAVLATPSDPRCVEAKKAKVAFHQNQSGAGPLPEAFGNITDMQMNVIGTSSETGQEMWAGFIELCSWIQASDRYIEYFWHIDLRYDGPVNSNQTVEKNKDGVFARTLSPLTPALVDLMEPWIYKIHGKENAVQITNVWRNGTFVDPSVDKNVYVSEYNCFDLFLDLVDATPPTQQLDTLRSTGTLDLDDLFSRCLGRCDGLWMATR